MGSVIDPCQVLIRHAGLWVLGWGGERAELGLPDVHLHPITLVPYDQVRIILTWRPDVSCGRVTIERWRL